MKKENANPIIYDIDTSTSGSIIIGNGSSKTDNHYYHEEWDTIVEAFGIIHPPSTSSSNVRRRRKLSIEDYTTINTLQELYNPTDTRTNPNGTTTNHNNCNKLAIFQRIGVWDVISRNNDQPSNNVNPILDNISIFQQHHHQQRSYNNTSAKRQTITSRKNGSSSYDSTKNSHSIPTNDNNDAATANTKDNNKVEYPITVDEIFNIIRTIQDPEHPLTLEQLGVVSKKQISITYNEPSILYDVVVRYKPTIPHCSMATLIGLCLRVKLLRSIPSSSSSSKYKVTVAIQPGTHNTEYAINKQLYDKERVYAALENKHLLSVVNKCIANKG